MATGKRQKTEPSLNETKQGQGVTMTRSNLFDFLDHIHRVDYTDSRYRRMIRPVCIWGQAGIGKTEIVMDYARSRGWDFAYCAPAQFEEMGDFHGMPVVEEGRTTYARPSWVPVSKGRPGILLLDDFNRADERILKGMMQLFQNHGLMSWELPLDWHIVCTANPDQSDYAVTRLDEAMLTRLLHATLAFDHVAWAGWAIDNGIDRRGVDFVLTYPETALGRLTNPRTLTTFFRHTGGIVDLKKDIRLVEALGSSLLDRETVLAFLTFIREDLSAMPSAEELLDTESFDAFETSLRRMVCQGDAMRLDILGTLVTRLTHLLSKVEPTESHIRNLMQFCQIEWLPNDIRTSLMIALPPPVSQRLAGVKSIARLMVS
jgi:hypothetical protein